MPKDADSTLYCPYALSIKAIVALVSERTTQAEEYLDEADDRALKSGDQAAYQVASAVRIRLYIAQAPSI